MDGHPYDAEALTRGIELTIAGGRPHDLERLEDRLLAFVMTVQRAAYSAGRLSVQNPIREALGIR